MPLLNLPEIFYYSQSESRVQSSATPQGDIHFDHLLQNRPDYWINPSPSRVQKKKKLIIANCAPLPLLIKFGFINKIEELIAEGFEIYFWQEGALHRLKPSINRVKLTDLIIALQIEEAVFPDDIINTALLQYSFSRDDLHILDDWGIRNLVKKTPDNRYTIAVSNLKTRKDSFLKANKKNPYLIAGHSITEINLTTFNKDLNRVLNVLKKDHPETIITVKYCTVELEALETLSFLQAMEQNKNYSLGGLVFTPQNLASLGTLIINGSALKDTKSLVSTLRKATNLSALSIFNGHIEGLEWLPPAMMELSLLESTINHISLRAGELMGLYTLYLQNCNISAEDLKKFLAASPNLDSLSLSHCAIVGSCEIPDLSQLTTLTCPVMHYDILQKLIKKSPQLNQLELEGTYDSALQPFLDSLKPRIKVTWSQKETRVITSLISPPALPDSLRTQSQSDELSLDLNTKSDVNKKTPVQRIFYSVDGQENPLPNFYRLSAYNDIAVKNEFCSIKNAFSLKKKGDLELRPCYVRCSPVDVYSFAKQHQDKQSQAYYGKQTLVLTSQWQAVASLSAEETLLAYHLEPETAVEWSYSLRDNLYYVRSKTDAVTEVTMDFMVTVPKVKRALPASVEDLVVHYNKFTDASLTMPLANPTGHDYLQAIQKQGKGVCRHRSFAFKAEMATKHPQFPVRIINNDCHSYVEIYHEGHWVRRDLGGADTQLTFMDTEGPPPADTKTILPDESFEGRYLETWKKEKAEQESVSAFCQKILRPAEGTKRLIELSSTSDVQALGYLLQHQAHHSGQAVFYINSPDELMCAAPWIARQQAGKNINGVLTAGPGGRLYEFLTNNPGNEPRTLIINYANFKPDDVVRLNTLLDKEPQIDGISIPASVRVVGLTNTQGPHYYSGEDFYSRFDDVVTGPQSSALTDAQKRHVIAPKLRTTEDTKVTPVRLFHSLNWKNELLGHWVMDGTQIRFKEGLLQKALDKGLPLVIHQGLWDNEEFVAFWQRAKLYGCVEHSGGVLKIPQDLQLLREDDYDWSYLTQNIQGSEVFDESAQLLNPGSFSQFFGHYTCDNQSKTLNRQSGLIETAGQTANKSLNVYLTRALTEDQWAMLGNACHEQGVTLRVHPARGVVLPAILPIKPIPADQADRAQAFLQPTRAIQSTDVDVTVAMLTAHDSNWLALDVTGCHGTDLLTKIHASFDAQALSFEFTQTQQALLTALQQGKKVILKGDFSPELLDELAPLLKQRAQEAGNKTPLVLVGRDLSQGHYLTTVTHQVTVAEKEACLDRDFSAKERGILSQDLLKTESLSRLKARLIHQRIHPGVPSDAAWSGLIDLPPRAPLAPLLASDDTSAMARAFHQQRKTEVMTALKHAPYVYLTGLTGGGKSTFVEKHLKTDANIAFYSGHTSLKNWALDQTPGKMKLFFEDEINLSQRQWHELEGLFDNPPGILIEGVYYPLTAEHRFIMAGNPMAYGDERSLSPVFQRHGNALLFDALPLACVYEDILKPVFANTALTNQSWAICQPILEVYQFLLTHSKTTVLISPRELQMMAILTLSHCQQTPKANPVDVACYYAQQVTQHLVPETQREAYAALPLMIKAQQYQLNQSVPRYDEELDFLLTSSRVPVVRQLTDLLALSELRKKNAAHFNPAQLYGGLGGLILTGDVGIGKSETVIAVLRQQGYQERHFKPRLATESDEVRPSVSQKIFYRMPAGLPFKAKQQLILKAFDEGAVLLADEINSSAMLERWFNDLLMGKHPLTGQPPKIPGFTLIGSQNPVTLAGRRQASPATDRRLLRVALSPYPHQEMVAILIQKGVSAIKAEHLVTVFDSKRAYALEHHLKPPPVFRDLLKLAELTIKRDYQQALNSLEQTINTLTDEQVAHHARAFIEVVGRLNRHTKNNEKNLMPYLMIIQQLLSATPQSRPDILAQFRQKMSEAQGHPSPLWQQLGKAMLGLGIALGIMSAVALAATGLGIVVAVGMGVAAVSTLTSVGLFAANRPQGLVRAMGDLEWSVRHGCSPGEAIA